MLKDRAKQKYFGQTKAVNFSKPCSYPQYQYHINYTHWSIIILTVIPSKHCNAVVMFLSFFSAGVPCEVSWHPFFDADHS